MGRGGDGAECGVVRAAGGADGGAAVGAEWGIVPMFNRLGHLPARKKVYIDKSSTHSFFRHLLKFRKKRWADGRI